MRRRTALPGSCYCWVLFEECEHESLLSRLIGDILVPKGERATFTVKAVTIGFVTDLP